MDLYSISMPTNSHNVAAVRKLAKSKDYSLKKKTNVDLFDLTDNQTGSKCFSSAKLDEIYDFLVSSDD